MTVEEAKLQNAQDGDLEGDDNSDRSKWYTDIVQQAELADYAPVKGCMVIKPYGYALWERIQGALDGMIKETGHQKRLLPTSYP